MKRFFLRFTILLAFGFAGFGVKVEARSARVSDQSFSEFWTKFKTAVARNDKAAVASMTKFPFLYLEENIGREKFIKIYSQIFTATVKRCIAVEKPEKDGKNYSIGCDGDYYTFEYINGVYKFTGVPTYD
jgi:hypothetical protein